MNIITTSINGVLIIEPKVFKDTRGYFFESFSQRDFKEKALEPLETVETAEGLKPFAGISKLQFVQDNESMSTYGVMRGLHFQRPPYTQSKLVRCVKGAVLDVAVDIRKGSPTYGQHVDCLLCAHDEEGERIAEEYLKNHLKPSDARTCSLSQSSATERTLKPSETANFVGRQFFVPRGFAHGFAVLSETAVFQYKCDEFYHPEADGGISILDDSLGIDWHLPCYGLPPKQEDERGAILSEKDTKHPLLKDFDSPFNLKDNLY